MEDDKNGRLSVDFMYIIEHIHKHIEFMECLEETILNVIHLKREEANGHKFEPRLSGTIDDNGKRVSAFKFVANKARAFYEENLDDNYWAARYVAEYIMDHGNLEPLPPLWDQKS